MGLDLGLRLGIGLRRRRVDVFQGPGTILSDLRGLGGGSSQPRTFEATVHAATALLSGIDSMRWAVAEHG